MAVIGPAEDFLQLLDARIERVAEGRIEAISEYLHRIAQPLAGDAHLVELGIIAQVAEGCLLQFLQAIKQHRPGEVYEDRRRGLSLRGPDVLDGPDKKRLKRWAF